MSRRRNRHRSLSSSSRLIEQRPTLIINKSILMRTTAPSFYTPPSRLNEQVNYESHKQDHLYNKHITFFRGNFNQNDSSQLPFMSSLRQRHTSNSQRHNNNEEEGQKTGTLCQPFQAALKNTVNQATKKNISDFSAKQDRMAVSFYRWHNQSGRNNKWGVQFQCSLREYGGQPISPEKHFYPYIKPIVYSDVETAIYDKSEMTCPRHHKSFKIR